MFNGTPEMTTPEDAVVSRHGARVRLPAERWAHILAGHPELDAQRGDVLSTVAEPDEIRAGRDGALLAIRAVGPARWIAVVYRELDADGFVVTAMLTSRYAWIARRSRLWPN